MLRLLLTTALAAAPVLWAGAAVAQCTPDAPANGATVTCTGTDSNGFRFGATDSITLNVLGGALVTNIDTLRAVDLGNGAQITVTGAVSSSNADAIRVQNDGTVVVLSSPGIISATGPDADGIQGESGLDLDLFGTITAGKDGVNAGDDADIFLGSSARITAGDEGLQLGNNAVVRTTEGSVIDATDEGIEAGDNAEMILRGTITAFDDAVQVGEGASIQNLGRIANIQTPANIAVGDEAQDGIDLDSGIIYNGSTVNSTAEISSTFGDAIDYDVSASGTISFIENYGLIRGGNRAVETDPLNTSRQFVANYATGQIIGGSGLALNLGAGADRYIHFAGATLTGGIDFGSGDDNLLVFGMPSGRLGGAGAIIEGGEGNDFAIFDGFAFDQIAGTVAGTTIDFRLGSGPDPFLVTLASFELFRFAAGDYTFAQVADRLRAPEVIPLPASALLLIGGLGGLAALRRRRNGNCAQG